MITEGPTKVNGFLVRDEEGKPYKYVFKITDYISELLAGNVTDIPQLGVRVLNPTDLPVSLVDSIVRNYNWSPKAVMLLNNDPINGARRAQLKISYTLKTEDN